MRPRVWSSVGDEQPRCSMAKRPSRQRSRTCGQGKIVALRGLGGYQLLVDATNQAAVERLRDAKGPAGASRWP